MFSFHVSWSGDAYRIIILVFMKYIKDFDS